MGSSGTYLHNVKGDGFAGLVPVLHVAFQINIEKFKDQIQLLIRVYDVKEPARRVVPHSDISTCAGTGE